MPATSAKRGGKEDPMQKRIPENPRYKNVKPTIDTGASVSKYMHKIEEIRKNYKFRKDEIFKRMKVTTFVQLAVQVNRIMGLEAYGDPDYPPDSRPGTVDAELGRLGRQDGDGNTSPVPSLALTEGDYGAKVEPDSSRSTLLSVSRGVGELDLNAPPPGTPSQGGADDSQPYLLLDVRDPDEYNQCHITTALSYPKAILSRAVNYESKEMLAYKNREGKIIIVYDEDERIGPPSATTLVQRGYDNLFILSGGLKVAAQIFPEGLISGTLPESLTGKKPGKKGASGNVPYPMSPPALPTEFSPDDIDKIEIYLDNALQDNSIGTSSRLSKASTSASRTTSRSTARSVSSASSQVPTNLVGRPAFK